MIFVFCNFKAKQTFPYSLNKSEQNIAQNNALKRINRDEVVTI
jgi:hypothetical protein